MAPRKPADTTQVTLRVPKHLLEEAEMVAKLISTTGFEASASDAMRAAMARGFGEIAREQSPFFVQGWDGVRSTRLFHITNDAKDASTKARELARTHAGDRWTVFRVYGKGKADPIDEVAVAEPGKGRRS